MMRTLMVGVASLVFGAAAAVAQEEHAKVRLISETKALMPGKTAWLALHFEIDDKWHLYWNGINDSGFAPRLNPEFPEGYKAGEFLWPAPKRYVQPGDILDHIYENHVTLMFPVEVPGSVAPGERVEFKASPEWLVCHDVCLPGGADVKLTLPVVDQDEGAPASDDAGLFAKARLRLPKPLPKDNVPVVINVAEGKVSIQAVGAAELAYYPGLNGVVYPSLIKEGQRKGDKLVLSFRKGTDGASRLKGVLEVKPQEPGEPMLWQLDVDLESVNKATPGPSDTDTRSRGD
ncbi:MAG: hypothetical protein KF678_07495 [Phycisphaeraceae bacterium]|nr:hypothetical protein [Phycisphaeraceae bacterium]